MALPKNGRKGRENPLSAEEIEATKRLKAYWDMRQEGITQKLVAEKLGATQSVISQYLSGYIPLNAKAVLIFSNVLKIDPLAVAPFMKDLINTAKEANALIHYATFKEDGMTKLEAGVQMNGWTVPTTGGRAILCERGVGADFPAGTLVIYDTQERMVYTRLMSVAPSRTFVLEDGNGMPTLVRVKGGILVGVEDDKAHGAVSDADGLLIYPVIAKMCLSGL
jgi:predicted transcriptional regulator